MLGRIKSGDAVASGDAEELTGVEVVNDRRLKVSLSEPRVEFPMLLADPLDETAPERELP